MSKRMLLIVLVVSTTMLAMGTGPRLVGTADALPPDQGPDPTGMTIPYPGRLNDEAGQPVADGAYDFAFALYDAETGGEALWSEVQEEIAVQEGAFNVLMGSVDAILMETLTAGEGWLAVGVRGPGETDFTDLTPRQRLTDALSASIASPAAPSDGAACPHDHWAETWTGSGVGLTLSDAVGNEVWIPGILAAVFGDSNILGGVWGRSNSNIGVLGESTSGIAGWFNGGEEWNDLVVGGETGRVNSDPDNENSVLYLSSNADLILKLDNDGGENHVFRIKDSTGADVFTCDESGNCSSTGTKPATVKTDNYGWRRVYAMESPEVWFEDVGSASLVDGESRVAFEPIFAETVNLEKDYHVFVTPLCQEPVLLFVTAKDATGFAVKGVTLDGEPSECAFDYRVVAKRLGYEDVRLEETTWQESE